MRRVASALCLLIIALLAFRPAFASSANRPYEDLLKHRLGFARHVTGGAGGELVVLDRLDFNLLKQALAGDEPRWIRFKPGLKGAIELKGHLYIGSNKTLDGRGADITLTSPDDCDEVRFWGLGEDWNPVKSRRNLIVHDIKIIRVGNGNNCGQGLGLAFNAEDVWVDHVTFSHNGDESLSLGKGATDVTVSWCKFIDTDKALLLSWGGQEDADLDRSCVLPSTTTSLSGLTAARPPCASARPITSTTTSPTGTGAASKSKGAASLTPSAISTARAAGTIRRPPCSPSPTSGPRGRVSSRA